MGLCDLSCLKVFSMMIGCVLVVASVAGVGFSIFLLFGEPLAKQTYDTYKPNWENIGDKFPLPSTLWPNSPSQVPSC